MQRLKKGKGALGATQRKKAALGRGLASLIPDIDSIDNSHSEFFRCEVGRITPNPFQPRKHFSEKELRELSDSIRENGVLQPLLVRKKGADYELIAGERRLRASQMAGLTHVPAILKEISDTELLELSIIENIQRENLNPIEESRAYQRLMEEFDFTQEKVAERVGKSRPAVANFLRLLQLPETIQQSIQEGVIAMGHARALLAVEDPAAQEQAWKRVVEEKLSVRETEKLVKALKAGTEKPAEEKPKPAAPDPRLKDYADTLSKRFSAPVAIRQKGKKGKVEIAFASEEELGRLMELLGTLGSD